jgi:hypothetical protein
MSEATEAPARTCGAPTKNGGECRVFLNLGPDGRCPMHSPARIAERAARAPRPGAKPGRVPPAPKTLEDAEKFLSWLPRAVCTGALGAREGHVAVAGLKEFCSAFSKRSLEAQVKALRKELAEARQAGGRSV